MIQILHGEHTLLSRTKLIEFKKQAADKEVIVLNGKNLQDSELVQALSSHSLFTEERVIIIEQLLGALGKKIKRATELITIINNYHEGNDVILWEEKELAKSILAQFPKTTKIHLYSYPSILFQVLDSFQPQRILQFIQQYKTLTDTQPPEIVHVLLLRRFRQLLAVKQGIQYPGIQPWQFSRLTNQARFFTMEQLLQGYQSFLELELAQKSGASVLELAEATELTVIRLYI